MKVLTTSAILGLCAIESFCLAQVPVVQFYIGGGQLIPGQGYQSYNINVPQDGSTILITNPIDVYTIIPSDTESDCTFIGRDGTLIRIDGFQQDILVQPLVSVTCLARSGAVLVPTYLTSFFPSLVTVTTPVTSISASTSMIPLITISTTSATSSFIASSAAGTGCSTASL